MTFVKSLNPLNQGCFFISPLRFKLLFFELILFSFNLRVYELKVFPSIGTIFRSKISGFPNFIWRDNVHFESKFQLVVSFTKVCLLLTQRVCLRRFNRTSITRQSRQGLRLWDGLTSATFAMPRNDHDQTWNIFTIIPQFTCKLNNTIKYIKSSN